MKSQHHNFLSPLKLGSRQPSCRALPRIVYLVLHLFWNYFRLWAKKVGLSFVCFNRQCGILQEEYILTYLTLSDYQRASFEWFKCKRRLLYINYYHARTAIAPTRLCKEVSIRCLYRDLLGLWSTGVLQHDESTKYSLLCSSQAQRQRVILQIRLLCSSIVIKGQAKRSTVKPDLCHPHRWLMGRPTLSPVVASVTPRLSLSSQRKSIFSHAVYFMQTNGRTGVL